MKNPNFITPYANLHQFHVMVKITKFKNFKKSCIRHLSIESFPCLDHIVIEGYAILSKNNP